MATQDLRSDRFAERNDLMKSDSFEFPLHEENVQRGIVKKEEDLTCKSEDDTIDSGDITAIRVCKSPDEISKQNVCQIPSIRDENAARCRYVHVNNKFVIKCSCGIRNID